MGATAKKRIVAATVLSLGTLAGCHSATRAERTVPVSNPGYAVEQLFTDANGHTIYRFADQGSYHYYVAGPPGARMVEPKSPKTEPDAVREPS